MKVRKCSILGCASVKKNPKISLFKVPKNNSLAWNLAINKYICKDTVMQFVCADHFLPEDIVSAYSIPPDVAIELGNRSKYHLRIGAIPSIFNSNVEDRIINYDLRHSINFDHSYAKQYYSKPSCRKKLFENRTSDAEAINLNESEMSFKHKLLLSELKEEQFKKRIMTLEVNFQNKMLSVYSILKPPKTGNCKILETNTTKISISDLKTVFNNKIINEREEKLKSLKQKLDLLAVQEISIDNVFDNNIHNYYNAGAKDCILYYICGYITKKFTKNITCDVCRTAVMGKTTYLDKPEATLVNLKSKGGLTHPNVFVFILLSTVELSFEKFCDNNDVFELTLENFFSEYGPIQFQCQDHKSDVLMSIISYYIITRMHQYTLIINKNTNKNNAKKKKLSKLVCT